MAVISSEEYDVFVKDKGADDSTYKGVGCVSDMQNMLKKGTRDVTTKDCVDKGSEQRKILGKIKHADGSIQYGFDINDTEGKKKLSDAFDNKTELTLKVELDDTGTTHSTYVERDVLVKEIDIAPDGEWTETVQLEFTSAPRFTPAD